MVQPSSIARVGPEHRSDSGGQVRLFWAGDAPADLQGASGWALVPDAGRAEVLCLPDTVDDADVAAWLADDPLKPVVFLGTRRAPAEFAVADWRSDALVEVLDDARAAALRLRKLRRGTGAEYAADGYRLALAFAFSRGGRISARLGDRQQGGFGYAFDFALGFGGGEPAEAMPLLASLTASGYLSEHLAEVAHACPACRAINLLLRDCCSACGSPDVGPVAVVHHFRCSYQAPEPDFLTPGNLYLCPKCRRELRHFGLDYDKPGELMVCGACGHHGTETVVRGRCLSCRHEFPASEAPRLRIGDYQLTDAGLHAVMSGQARVFDPLRLLGESLPLVPLDTLSVSVRQLAALEERGSVASTVLTIGLEHAIAATATSGEEISLLLGVGTELVKHLRKSDIAAYDRGKLYVLLPGASEEAHERIVARVTETLCATFEDSVVSRLSFSLESAPDFLLSAQSAAA